VRVIAQKAGPSVVVERKVSAKSAMARNQRGWYCDGGDGGDGGGDAQEGGA
jgi:hypothetical protein